jgi:hypothetical protein
VAELKPVSYERIWVTLLEREWRSLAVVPATDGGSASSVARGVARAGSQYLGQPVRLLSAETAQFGEGRRLLESLSEGGLHGTVISTASPTESETALLLVRNVDAVLLVVPLERTRVLELRRLGDEIGRDRIVGAVIAEA